MPAASAAPASFSDLTSRILHFMLHFYASTHDLSGEKKERALAAAACARTKSRAVKIVKIVKTVAQCVTGRGHNGPAVPPSHTIIGSAGISRED